ncbi:MAG: sensor histidine kinase [Anaerolineales bacterium]
MWRAAGFFLFMLAVGAAACVGMLWLFGVVSDSGPTISPVAMVIVLLAGLGLARMLGGLRRGALSLGDLIEAAGLVEEGDYSARIAQRGPRELRLLGRAFNDMAERLQLTETQRRNLLAELTHELRTPVSVIQGNLEGMLDGVYPADAAHLNPILEEVRQLSRLIDDLRTLSLSESGALELHLEPTELEVLTGEVAAAYRPQAQEKGISLNLDFPAELPPLELDPVRIREVLVNLLTNALRHTPPGGEVKIAATSDPVRRVATVRVTDSGPGIRPEVLPHIFERFYKSDGSGGSGLGLTIAKSLVTAHGGEIEAESPPDAGTTVRFTLPFERYNPRP